MTVNVVRAAGIAGILGSICWTIGDVLLVGAHASSDSYPLLLKTYAGRIPFGALHAMLPSSEPRLAAGALIADISVPLYLAGSWHLYQGARGAGRSLPVAIFILLLCGNAWSPLGHDAFYYPGMVYKTILEVPVDGHDALLALGSQFNHLLLIAWLLPVLTLACGTVLMGIAAVSGKSRYPRWAAAVLNPVTPLGIAVAAGALLPQPLSAWFDAAGLNVGFFIVYTFSTAVLWNGRRVAASTNDKF